MSSWGRQAQRFSRLPWPDRLLLIYVLVIMGLLRCMILLVPFRFIATRLGRKMAESPQENPGQAKYIRRISWAIEAVAGRTPWESKCLVQAIAAKMLLRRKGLHNTLYLGVSKGEDGSLIAHAWVRAGDRYVTGGDVRMNYTVVATFAD